MDCGGCHWYHPEDANVKCINLSMDNWIPNPVARCGEYIKTENYRPTEIWAGMAEVVQKVEDLMKAGDMVEAHRVTDYCNENRRHDE